MAEFRGNLNYEIWKELLGDEDYEVNINGDVEANASGDSDDEEDQTLTQQTDL